jgi:hypothetical protein
LFEACTAVSARIILASAQLSFLFVVVLFNEEKHKLAVVIKGQKNETISKLPFAK